MDCHGPSHCSIMHFYGVRSSPAVQRAGPTKNDLQFLFLYQIEITYAHDIFKLLKRSKRRKHKKSNPLSWRHSRHNTRIFFVMKYFCQVLGCMLKHIAALKPPFLWIETLVMIYPITHFKKLENLWHFTSPGIYFHCAAIKWKCKNSTQIELCSCSIVHQKMPWKTKNTWHIGGLFKKCIASYIFVHEK